MKDVYRCRTNPNGIEKDGKRTCGYLAFSTVEKEGGGACPHCKGEVGTETGLMAVAEMMGISWGTIKRAKTEIEIVSGRKGFGPGSIVYWRLPDGHPDIVKGAPTSLA